MTAPVPVPPAPGDSALRPAGRRVDVAWPMAIVLALATVDAAVTVPVAGREVALPAPQVGVLVAVAGAAVLVLQRRTVRLDVFLLPYLVLAAVPIVQSRLLDVPAAGGTGIFLTAALLLLALSQYDRSDRPVVAGLPAWMAVLSGFGVVLALWMTVLWLPALDDPGAFYDLKRSVSLPIGPGNFVAAVLLVPLVLVADQRDVGRWRLPLLGLLGLGFVVSLSRAGWLVLAAVLVVRWLWLRRRRPTDSVASRWSPRQWVAMGGGVVAVLALYLLTGSSPSARLGTLLKPAVGARLKIWDAAWDGWLDAPFAGFGLDGFAPLTAAVGRFETHPHNLVLAGLGMLGLIGGLVFVGVWLAGLRRALRGPDGFTLGLAALAIFLHAQVGAWSLYLVFELLFVMLLALAARGDDRARVVVARLPGASDGQ